MNIFKRTVDFTTYFHDTHSKYIRNSFIKLTKFNFFKRTIIKQRNRNYNFYEVLGLDQDCSNEQIRESYLKLAKKYHPDLNPELEDADDQFKMLTLAYETLSNKNNRSMYDSYMDIDPNTSNWDFENEEELKDEIKKDKAKYDRNQKEKYQKKGQSNFWEGETQRENFENDFYKDFERIFRSEFKQSKDINGEDIMIEIKIPFIESFRGVTKGVVINRKESCRKCKGFKSEPGHRPSKCFNCDGTGQIKTSLFNSKPCGHCKGIGVIIKFPCTECEGQGKKIYECTEYLTIPRGVRSDAKLTFEKKGHSGGIKNHINGDLIVKIIIEDSDVFKRIDNNAIFGCEIDYQTLEGESVKVNMNSGVQTKDKIVIKNKGMYLAEDNNNNRRGDLIINFNVKIPKGSIMSNTDKDNLKTILETI